jgi:hypothetical protein
MRACRVGGEEADMTTSGRSGASVLKEAVPAGPRTIRARTHDQLDPAEPWERPADQEVLRELSTRRFERLPHRPATMAEVPDGALADLKDIVGDVGLERLFVIPRSSRMAGPEHGHWVETAPEVVAVGADTIAIWIRDADGARIRATIRFDDVVAILDRTILLYGRLEIIGPDASLVVRYNTVGQPELRGTLLPARLHATPVRATLPEGLGCDPADLPHKWMALVRSREVMPRGMDSLVVAAGDVANPTPHLHDGVAVLSGTELVVATDPTPDTSLAQYGVDLLVVARSRLRSIGGHGDTLTVTVACTPRDIEIRLAAHPSLVAETTRLLSPLIGTPAG